MSAVSFPDYRRCPASFPEWWSVSGIFIFPDIDEAIPHLTEACDRDSWLRNTLLKISLPDFDEINVS
jgi:hypothetical protein